MLLLLTLLKVSYISIELQLPNNNNNSFQKGTGDSYVKKNEQEISRKETREYAC